MNYIYIHTDFNFKTNSTPIFALALLEPTRRIGLSSELTDGKSLEDVMALSGQLIAMHHKKHKELRVFGTVLSYVLNFRDERYLFDVDGNLVNHPTKIPSESKAEIRVVHQ